MINRAAAELGRRDAWHFQRKSHAGGGAVNSAASDKERGRRASRRRPAAQREQRGRLCHLRGTWAALAGLQLLLAGLESSPGSLALLQSWSSRRLSRRQETTLHVGGEAKKQWLHGSPPGKPNPLRLRNCTRNAKIYNHLPRLFCFLGGERARALGSNSPNSNDKVKPRIQCVTIFSSCRILLKADGSTNQGISLIHRWDFPLGEGTTITFLFQIVFFQIALLLRNLFAIKHCPHGDRCIKG